MASGTSAHHRLDVVALGRRIRQAHDRGEFSSFCASVRIHQRKAVGGDINPRANGAAFVTLRHPVGSRIATKGQAEVRDGCQPPYSMIERGSLPSPVNAGLRPPPPAADGVDRWLAGCRWLLIERRQREADACGKLHANFSARAGFARIWTAVHNCSRNGAASPCVHALQSLRYADRASSL